jgi:type I protein arginine methyltransferase
MASPDLFPNVSFSDVSAGATLAADGATAAFGVDATSGGPRLSLVRAGKPEVEPTMEIDLSDAQVVAVISMNVIWE